MSELDQLAPKSLSGIKSLAKKIKKRDGITHSEALDLSARQAGFASYRDAYTSLAEDAE